MSGTLSCAPSSRGEGKLDTDRGSGEQQGTSASGRKAASSMRVGGGSDGDGSVEKGGSAGEDLPWWWKRKSKVIEKMDGAENGREEIPEDQEGARQCAGDEDTSKLTSVEEEEEEVAGDQEQVEEEDLMIGLLLPDGSQLDPTSLLRCVVYAEVLTAMWLSSKGPTTPQGLACTRELGNGGVRGGRGVDNVGEHTVAPEFRADPVFDPPILPALRMGACEVSTAVPARSLASTAISAGVGDSQAQECNEDKKGQDELDLVKLQEASQVPPLSRMMID